MRLPLAWLKEFVDVPGDTQAIADRLAMLGFPVGEIERRPPISGVVVGKIQALEKHPNADRLQVARVDVGGEKPLTIATAATNVAAGQVIAVALIGAQLPALRIEPRTMRGIASEGMMISADELALPAEWFEDGILQLEPDRRLGADVVALFGLQEAVLDVEVTTNRVDAMSVLGLARELAASYGLPLRPPSFENPATSDDPRGEAPCVEIQSPDCTRFVAQRFDAIRVETAPAWMRVRLALAGQRPINNLVDVSNYVMLETGQPLHFYDAATIEGGRLIVRDARAGETTVTLDGIERALSPQALVIADERRTLCLAGLMGAQAGAVGQTTTAIVLEAANFNGSRIRRMSQALGLRSEASSRHEKMLAPALTDVGAARAAQILSSLGAKGYRPHAFGAALAPVQAIELHGRDVERLLGLTLEPRRVCEDLESLGCSVVVAGGTFAVTPPPWRRDLTIAADLIEELARIEGYENIPSAEPPVAAHDISSAAYDRENDVARTLSALGYNEIVTYSLNGGYDDRFARAGLAPSGRRVAILNPISEDHRYLRDSLTPGLLEYCAKIDAPVRAFEIGHTFEIAPPEPQNERSIHELPVVAFAFAAEPREEPAWHDSHFLRLKGECEAFLRKITGRLATTLPDVHGDLHPGKSATMTLDGREAARLGQIDPRLQAAFGVRLPVYMCTLRLDTLPDYATPHYEPPSKFPSTYRDLAFVTGLDVAAADLERVLAGALGTICTRVRVFDEYRGSQVAPGHKSLAVRVTLARFDTTITDEEADEAVARALVVVHDELGATIRE